MLDYSDTRRLLRSLSRFRRRSHLERRRLRPHSLRLLLVADRLLSDRFVVGLRCRRLVHTKLDRRNFLFHLRCHA